MSCIISCVGGCPFGFGLDCCEIVERFVRLKDITESLLALGLANRVLGEMQKVVYDSTTELVVQKFVVQKS